MISQTTPRPCEVPSETETEEFVDEGVPPGLTPVGFPPNRVELSGPEYLRPWRRHTGFEPLET